MTKAALVEEVSRVADLTKKHSEVIVDTVFQSIITALRGRVAAQGLGGLRGRMRCLAGGIHDYTCKGRARN